MASTTQNIGLKTYDISTDNAADFITGTSQNMVAIDKAIATKVLVNNSPTNVNLFENKVVQDGLIKFANTNANFTAPYSTGDFGVYAKLFIKNYTTSENRMMLVGTWGTAGRGVIDVVYNAGGIVLLNYHKEDGSLSANNTGIKINLNNINHIYLSKVGETIELSVNGSQYVINNSLCKKTFSAGITIETTIQDILCVAVYNKKLSQQEIQHNFNVLNNSPSINKINDYVIASDTDHITDSGSILQSKINRVFYKNMCKEISSNGSDIVVNNGLEGYLLSATLQGDTKVFKSLKGKNAWSEIPSTETRDTVTYDYKLESTKAIMSNNGVKYSFYANAEDKLSGKVIDLGGIDGARNTLEIKEDGSAIYTQNSYKKVLDGSEAFAYDTASTPRFRLAINDWKQNTVLTKSNCIVSEYFYDNDKKSDKSYLDYFGYLYLYNFNYTDIVSFKKNLSDKYNSQNPVTIYYILATPIVTIIPKELVPVILTQVANNIVSESAVAPYNMTLNIPTTDDIKKSYDKLVLLNGYTQTVGTATPVVNLLNTRLVRLQMDLTAPSTLLNATLFSVAPELRPVTNAKIPIFVNGVCVLGVVDKTTGNVNLPSIPPANANIYIKTDYRRDI